MRVRVETDPKWTAYACEGCTQHLIFVVRAFEWIMCGAGICVTGAPSSEVIDSAVGKSHCRGVESFLEKHSVDLHSGGVHYCVDNARILGVVSVS